MTRDERVRLLDAATRSPNTEAFLVGVQSAFDIADRQDDALTASVLRSLLREGEIEAVMRMRAEWLGQRDAPRESALG